MWRLFSVFLNFIQSLQNLSYSRSDRHTKNASPIFDIFLASGNCQKSCFKSLIFSRFCVLWLTKKDENVLQIFFVELKRYRKCHIFCLLLHWKNQSHRKLVLIVSTYKMFRNTWVAAPNFIRHLHTKNVIFCHNHWYVQVCSSKLLLLYDIHAFKSKPTSFSLVNWHLVAEIYVLPVCIIKLTEKKVLKIKNIGKNAIAHAW